MSLKVPGSEAPETVSELSGRKKVMLAPGHSLMDWIRLGRSQGDLSGVTTKRRELTMADLALHNRPDDMWMALRGKVYNISPYLHYHPGGVDELMRAAGKDGTQLFDEIHSWVNVESMLEKCLVGYLSSVARKESIKEKKPRKPSLAPSIIRPPAFAAPTHDWYQSNSHVVVVVYTKYELLRREFVMVEILPAEVTLHVFLLDYSYFVHFKPSFPLKDTPTILVSKGKVEVKMEIISKDKKWPSLGEYMAQNEDYFRTKNLAPTKYRKWAVTKNSPVTHNTVLLRLRAPKGLTMNVPIGYHIHIVHSISGMQIGRSYTVVSPSIIDPKSDMEQEEGKAIHLMVKNYIGGALTPYVTSVKAGDTMMISNFDGNFDLERLNKTTHLVLFAAGTGFTSMVRLITYALDDMPGASFPIKLVCYNKTQGDILWREQLDKLVAEKSRFSVTHVLSQESANSSWKGLRGRVCSTHVQEFVPSPGKNCHPLLCICGQWAYNDSVESLARLQRLQDEHIHVFAQTS